MGAAAVGIEAAGVYAGRAMLDVRQLFEARNLDMRRFENLMMAEKSVNLPCEDAVTNAVNAARPLLARLAAEERDSIELVIVGTESGLDFGKPISTYVHDYLGLGRRCRSFEVKHACYGGTAALQMAATWVASSPVPGRKALVIAADAASAHARGTYWEPSQGAGAVALLVGDRPDVLELDPGACGYYSYEVMDTLRPRPDLEAGDSDLSLLSYMHCLEQSYALYCERVRGAGIQETFDYLVFHTPFAGMVRSAHRTLLRKHTAASPEAVEDDFESRVAPSLRYCARIGNVYSAALYLALCSLVDHVDVPAPVRAGLYSYGSGCASEFYSGLIGPRGRAAMAHQDLGKALDQRHRLSMQQYEAIGEASSDRMAGVQDARFPTEGYDGIYERGFAGQELLVLDEIADFHRVYRWS